jgi:hypothetical protein
VITHVERLSDGRYNIVLRGIERFRIAAEQHQHNYRVAVVDSLRDAVPSDEDREAIRHHRSQLEALLAPSVERGAADPKMPSAMADEDVVNALAQYLDLEPLEKQALLERQSIRSRAEALVELLEMKMMMARTPGLSHVAH